MRALSLFSTELRDCLGALLAQVIRVLTDPFQSKEEEDVFSTCTIHLPFSVKPDFQEDFCNLMVSSLLLYIFCDFYAFERNFSMLKKHLVVRKIMKEYMRAASVTTGHKIILRPPFTGYNEIHAAIGSKHDVQVH